MRTSPHLNPLLSGSAVSVNTPASYDGRMASEKYSHPSSAIGLGCHMAPERVQNPALALANYPQTRKATSPMVRSHYLNRLSLPRQSFTRSSANAAGSPAFWGSGAACQPHPSIHPTGTHGMPGTDIPGQILVRASSF